MNFDKDLDAKGLNCPLPILRAKKALAEMSSGQVLRIMSTDPGSVKDFAAFAKSLADQYLVMERGEIVQRGAGADMDKDGVRQLLSV